MNVVDLRLNLVEFIASSILTTIGTNMSLFDDDKYTVSGMCH